MLQGLHFSCAIHIEREGLFKADERVCAKNVELFTNRKSNQPIRPKLLYALINKNELGFAFGIRALPRFGCI